ncbi:heat shock protein 90 [Rubripirellula lacrimiformis]|uniref:Heat shock protein 90 n=1 Tax=Rubripirellula lacrimiformis TaxID=1930273 RepID=A0A517N727_9BACT|nr:ATP-binding protein [Rubripirellula lacrimiformis]QDT02954.1 heat shock protein 90 [Rubripirellula lacrimiformis]
MTISFKESNLYSKAFKTEGLSVDAKKAANRLESVLDRFRETAAVLAEDVARSVPQLTDHSIHHLDALWTTASQIAGEEWALNPLEAFVLGGAFLIHDLGNAICAFPNRIEDLYGDRWNDLVAKNLIEKHGRRPTKKEVSSPPDKIKNLIVLQRLRQEHANACVALATKGIHFSDGPYIPLIEDREICGQLGRLIGEIAASHHWPIEKVASKLNQFAALSGVPQDWQVDALLIACILRCADACQVDRRRAPPLRQAVFQPEAASRKHWIAQQRLNLPTVRRGSGVLEFRSNQPFAVDERESWQIAFDLVAKNASKELEQTSALLKREGRREFAVRRIAGAESVAQFSKYVETEGWLPVDVSIQITDVANVVDRFGGQALYGENTSAPVRELIANTADAVRARRNVVTGGHAPSEGKITIRLFEDEHGWCLEVVDDGLGMSQQVMTGPLLDFGSSFWTSDLALQELPGLLASEFSPTGKFGIGFFSIFMIADSVSVTSHRFDQSHSEAVTIELEKGQLTPLLRKSTASEICPHGGTRIKARLNRSPWTEKGLVGKTPISSRENALVSRIASIAPTIDVNIDVQVDSQTSVRTVVANDWLDLSFSKLWNRLCDGRGDRMQATIPETVRFVRRDECLGRIAFHEPDYSTKCAVTVGGLNAGWLEGACAGVLLGRTDLMSRNSATPFVDGLMLADELKRLKDAEPNPYDKPAVHLTAMMRHIGVVPSKLPMFMTYESDAMTGDSLSDWAAKFKPGEEVLVNLTGTFEHDDGLGNSGTLRLYRKDVDFDLKSNVVLAPELNTVSLLAKLELVPKLGKSGKPVSMLTVVQEIFANAWKVGVADIEPSWMELEVGDYYARESHDITLEVAVFERPKRV